MDWCVHSELANGFSCNESVILVMSDFFQTLVMKPPEEIEKLGLIELPFLMNLCHDSDQDLFIHKACHNNSVFWVKRFLSKRTSRSKGAEGKTILHIACESSNLAMLNTLVDFVDVDAFEDRDNNSYTAIDHAANNLDTYLINYLLESTNECITQLILIKLPSILCAMMMCSKSDSVTLEAVKAVMGNINRIREDNELYQEITKNIDPWDSLSSNAKPCTKQYINTVLKIWETN